MKKIPNSFYALMAITLTTSVLSGCITAPVENAEVTTEATVETGTAVKPAETTETAPTPSETTKPETSATPAPVTSPAVDVKVETSVETSVQTYKDATYSESASYQSPAGNENVTFKFTLVADKVTDVSLAAGSENETSKNFQKLFAEGIGKEVVGKKLSEVGTFSHVNGSSLTSKAFNSAVAQLKVEAKS